MGEAEHCPGLAARPNAVIAPPLQAEQPRHGAGLRVESRCVTVRAVGANEPNLEDGIEMAIGERRALRVPLRRPQHRWKVEPGIDDDAVGAGDLQERVGLPVEDVGEVVAARKCPFFQVFASGDLIAQRQRVIHVDSGGGKHRRMPGENRADPLADPHGGVRVALFAGQQMQEPETARPESRPTENLPSCPRRSRRPRYIRRSCSSAAAPRGPASCRRRRRRHRCKDSEEPAPAFAYRLRPSHSSICNHPRRS